MPVFENIIFSAQQVIASKDMLTNKLDRVTQDVSQAKLRAELKPQVDEFLSELEYEAQKRSIDSFELMLTSMVNDVLPRDNQRVSIKLTTQRNAPALYVYLNQNGFDEDVLTGQGGAVANVLSTALRFIALARTSANRKFIILDEPDCWISPDRVSNFSYVIHKIAEELNIQVVYISHHNPEYLTGTPIKLSLVDNAVAVKLPSQQITYGDIKQIRLVNFMSHKDTIIPLSDKVSLITGDNNIGKSAVVSAVRAVAYGESNDTYIRHGEESTTVEITFKDDSRIVWQRFLNGKVKVQYDLYDVNNDLLSAATTAAVPDWVLDKLGIVEIDNIDVQLNSQKSPIFLINEPPSKRAAILSIGQESKYLNSMRVIWKRQIDDDKKTIKAGEEFATKAKEILKLFDDADIQNSLKILQQKNYDIQQQKSKSQDLQKTINQLDKLLKDTYSLLAVESIVLPKVPALATVDFLATVANGLENLLKIMNCFANSDGTELILSSPKTPELTNTDELVNIGKQLVHLSKTLVFKIPEMPKVPEIKDTAAINSMFELSDQGKLFKKDIENINTEIAQLKDDIEAVFTELGVCPFCGQKVNESILEHTYHIHKGGVNEPVSYTA
jgi:AAA15 family ATPase/GTPase